VRNAFYRSPNALQVPIPDAVLEKLIARGVKVAACGLAITVYSGMAAQKIGLKHEDVKKDWTDAVLPGIQIVPSGVVACNGAASRGCAYVFAG
jgi:intracellular sulfur oxidation DsrE/DsrF family protein